MRYLQLALVLFGLLLSCNPKEKEKTTYLASEGLKMAAPLLECDNIFFTDSVKVAMEFSLPDSNIKYTLDGTDVTNTSKTYEKPIRLHKTTRVTAKNFHPEFQPSIAATLKVVKTNSMLMGSTIQITPAPNERYQANEALSLNDHVKGTTSFTSDNAWLGFQSESVQMNIDFTETKRLSKVTVSTMTNHGAWIFLPKKIAVFSGKLEVGAVEVSNPSQEDKSGLEFIEIPIKEDTYNNLRIIVSSLSEIPEWHQGKGTLPWFFTDEILVE